MLLIKLTGPKILFPSFKPLIKGSWIIGKDSSKLCGPRWMDTNVCENTVLKKQGFVLLGWHGVLLYPVIEGIRKLQNSYKHSK